jgi:hypothetical protein
MRANRFVGSGDAGFRITSLAYKSDGGALYIDNMSKVAIDTTNNFSNLRGRFGGAIYFNSDKVSAIALKGVAGESST